MSTQSDEQTIDRQSIITFQTLIKQSSIKDLALAKATNLIDLLSLQLQAERIKREEQVRQVEEELREQFEKEIIGLNEKIQFLQRELKRSNAIKSFSVINQRHPTISRTNSSNSLSAVRKKSNNKKYTQMNTQENNYVPKSSTVQLTTIQDYLLNYQEWKETVVDDLNSIAFNDYQELKNYLDRVQEVWAEIDYTFAQPANPNIVQWQKHIQNQNLQMKAIITQQQKCINQLKAHIQELQDTYKHMAFKLTNMVRVEEKHSNYIDMHSIIVDLKVIVGEGKKFWQKKYSCLQEQNIELKSILDSIINLVQVQRRNQF